MIFEINQIKFINWRQYKNVQIFQSIDFFLYLRIWFLWSSRKMTRSRYSLIDKSIKLIAWILTMKKIKRLNSIDSIDSILIRFIYRSSSSRLIIVLTIMIHSFQSSSFSKITFVLNAVEFVMKNIFDIVLIRRLISQQKNNEAKNKKWDNDSIN